MPAQPQSPAGTPTPTATTFNGSAGLATCLAIIRRDHLAKWDVLNTGVRQMEEHYLIRWDKPSRVFACYGATDGTTTLPGRTTPHDALPILRGKTSSIIPIDHETYREFDATVTFTDELDNSDSPLNLPPKIRWSATEDGQSPYFLDNNPNGAKPCVTSAGEQFADFLQRAGGSLTATYSVNVVPTAIAGKMTTAIGYIAAVPSGGSGQGVPCMNSDGFTIDGLSVAVGQARFKGAEASELQTSNGVQFRTMSYTLAFRQQWTDTVVDRGFYQLDGTNKLARITLSPTDPSEPANGWPLDGNGHAKANASDTPAVLPPFYPYPAKAFSVFGFQ